MATKLKTAPVVDLERALFELAEARRTIALLRWYLMDTDDKTYPYVINDSLQNPKVLAKFKDREIAVLALKAIQDNYTAGVQHAQD